MKSRFFNNLKNILPFFGFSAVAGIVSALLITAFKWGAEQVIHFSSSLYTTVRVHTAWLPLLVAGAVLLGFGVSFLLKKFPHCKGGGIPASVAAIRKIAPFDVLSSLLVLPFSALLTYLCGIPLGTEGPCVQMGTAVGQGLVTRFGEKKYKNHKSFVMTSSGAAGFSLATASPFSAIVFAVEDLNKTISPLLLTGVSLSVGTSWLTAKLVAFWGIGGGSLFALPTLDPLSLHLLFPPLAVGMVCGIGSVLFTLLYHVVHKQMKKLLKKASIQLLFPLLFGITALLGFFVADTLGTGHSLTQTLFTSSPVWTVLLLLFLLRAVLMILANTAGVTGGTFLPTLAFGAILGALCAKGMIGLHLLEPQHYPLMVVLGTVSFLAATNRIPLTAFLFSLEALGGIGNIPAIVVAIGVAYGIARISKTEEITNIAIQEKILHANKETAK